MACTEHAEAQKTIISQTSLSNSESNDRRFEKNQTDGLLNSKSTLGSKAENSGFTRDFTALRCEMLNVENSDELRQLDNQVISRVWHHLQEDDMKRDNLQKKASNPNLKTKETFDKRCCVRQNSDFFQRSPECSRNCSDITNSEALAFRNIENENLVAQKLQDNEHSNFSYSSLSHKSSSFYSSEYEIGAISCRSHASDNSAIKPDSFAHQSRNQMLHLKETFQAAVQNFNEKCQKFDIIRKMAKEVNTTKSDKASFLLFEILSQRQMGGGFNFFKKNKNKPSTPNDDRENERKKAAKCCKKKQSNQSIDREYNVKGQSADCESSKSKQRHKFGLEKSQSAILHPSPKRAIKKPSTLSFAEPLPANREQREINSSIAAQQFCQAMLRDCGCPMNANSSPTRPEMLNCYAIMSEDIKKKSRAINIMKDATSIENRYEFAKDKNQRKDLSKCSKKKEGSESDSNKVKPISKGKCECCECCDHYGNHNRKSNRDSHKRHYRSSSDSCTSIRNDPSASSRKSEKRNRSKCRNKSSKDATKKVECDKKEPKSNWCKQLFTSNKHKDEKCPQNKWEACNSENYINHLSQCLSKQQEKEAARKCEDQKQKKRQSSCRKSRSRSESKERRKSPACGRKASQSPEKCSGSKREYNTSQSSRAKRRKLNLAKTESCEGIHSHIRKKENECHNTSEKTKKQCCRRRSRSKSQESVSSINACGHSTQRDARPKQRICDTSFYGQHATHDERCRRLCDARNEYNLLAKYQLCMHNQTKAKCDENKWKRRLAEQQKIIKCMQERLLAATRTMETKCKDLEEIKAKTMQLQQQEFETVELQSRKLKSGDREKSDIDQNANAEVLDYHKNISANSTEPVNSNSAHSNSKNDQNDERGFSRSNPTEPSQEKNIEPINVLILSSNNHDKIPATDKNASKISGNKRHNSASTKAEKLQDAHQVSNFDHDSGQSATRAENYATNISNTAAYNTNLISSSNRNPGDLGATLQKGAKNNSSQSAQHTKDDATNEQIKTANDKNICPCCRCFKNICKECKDQNRLYWLCRMKHHWAPHCDTCCCSRRFNYMTPSCWRKVKHLAKSSKNSTPLPTEFCLDTARLCEDADISQCRILKRQEQLYNWMNNNERKKISKSKTKAVKNKAKFGESIVSSENKNDSNDQSHNLYSQSNNLNNFQDSINGTNTEFDANANRADYIKYENSYDTIENGHTGTTNRVDSDREEHYSSEKTGLPFKAYYVCRPIQDGIPLCSGGQQYECSYVDTNSELNDMRKFLVNVCNEKSLSMGQDQANELNERFKNEERTISDSQISTRSLRSTSSIEKNQQKRRSSSRKGSKKQAKKSTKKSRSSGSVAKANTNSNKESITQSSEKEEQPTQENESEDRSEPSNFSISESNCEELINEITAFVTGKINSNPNFCKCFKTTNSRKYINPQFQSKVSGVATKKTFYPSPSATPHGSGNRLMAPKRRNLDDCACRCSQNNFKAKAPVRRKFNGNRIEATPTSAKTDYCQRCNRLCPLRRIDDERNSKLAQSFLYLLKKDVNLRDICPSRLQYRDSNQKSNVNSKNPQQQQFSEYNPPSFKDSMPLPSEFNLKVRCDKCCNRQCACKCRQLNARIRTAPRQEESSDEGAEKAD